MFLWITNNEKLAERIEDISRYRPLECGVWTRAKSAGIFGADIMKPLCIDIFCGLGGWAEGFLAEGWNVIGFDIEQHVYGEHQYPGQLVIQDATTLHGSQFKMADCLVMSPPCQEYSYMAMPWSIAKAKAAAIRADETGAELDRLNLLFNTCFRIQREASEAAGHHIPMLVENVRGAIPWVGRSRWNFGSFHLWGDVPALMPMTVKGSKQMGKAGPADRPDNRVGLGSWRERLDIGIKVPTMGAGWYPPDHPKHVKGLGFNTHAERNLIEGVKGEVPEGTKKFGKTGHPRILPQIVNKTGSGSTARKMASAMIAKIPPRFEPLYRQNISPPSVNI